MQGGPPIASLIIPGSIRSKKNSKRPVQVGRKGKKRLMLLPSKAYKAWEERVRWEARRQLPARFRPLACPVWVRIAVYYKGPRPDLSGACESVGDALEGFLWENDRQIESWDGSRLHHDMKKPRTVVDVWVYRGGIAQ